MSKKDESENVEIGKLRDEIAALDVHIYRLDEQKKEAKSTLKDKVERLSNLFVVLEDGQQSLSGVGEEKK